MAEEYFDRTPYGYCSNDPVDRIDPLGMTEYRIGPDGRVVEEIYSQNDDKFVIVDALGDVMYDTHGNPLMLYFSKKVVEEFKNNYFTDEEFKCYSHDYYRVRGDANAQMLFEFLAQNTMVEWGRTALGIAGDRGLNYITTSWNRGEEAGGVFLMETQFKYGYTVRSKTHSHRSGNHPSLEDYQSRNDLYRMQNTSMYLYFVPTGRYINYTRGNYIDGLVAQYGWGPSGYR